MDTNNRLIWTNTEQMSGHSLIVFAPLPDQGPWSQTKEGSGQRSWVAVGLRADTGIVDVARLDGPMSTVGVATPQQGSVLAQEAAVAIGEATAAGMDLPQRRSMLQKAMDVLKPATLDPADADTSKFKVTPVSSRKERDALLATLGDDAAAAMAGALRDHPALRSFHLEGAQAHKDPRVPGTVEALNTLNGTIPWTFTGKDALVQDVEMRAKWDAMIRENPAIPAAIGAVAAHATLPPHMNDRDTGPRTPRELAIALGGAIVPAEGEKASLRRAWVEGAILAPTTLDSTREGMVQALPALVKHGRETPEAVTAFCEKATTQLYPSDLDALAGGMAFARGLDRLEFDAKGEGYGRETLLAKVSLATNLRTAHQTHDARLDQAVEALAGTAIPVAFAAAERAQPYLADSKAWQEAKLPRAVHQQAALLILGQGDTVSMPALAERSKDLARSGAAWATLAFDHTQGERGKDAAQRLAGTLGIAEEPRHRLCQGLLPKAAARVVEQQGRQVADAAR